MPEAAPATFTPAETYVIDYTPAALERGYYEPVNEQERQMGGRVLAVIGITALGGAAATAGLVGTALHNNVHAEVNLAQSQTVSKNEVIEFVNGHELRVAKYATKVKNTTTGLYYDIFIKGAPYDTGFKADKQVEGITESEIMAPTDMIKEVTKDPATGKTIITLDMSKVLVNTHWANLSDQSVDNPHISNGSIVDGKFEACPTDCLHPQSPFGVDWAEALTHLGVFNKYKNTVVYIDKHVNAVLKNQALSLGVTACAGPLEDKVKKAAVEGFENAVKTLTGDKKAAVEVIFDGNKLKMNPEKVPEKVEQSGADIFQGEQPIENMKIVGNPELSSVTCDVSGVQ